MHLSDLIRNQSRTPTRFGNRFCRQGCRAGLVRQRFRWRQLPHSLSVPFLFQPRATVKLPLSLKPNLFSLLLPPPPNPSHVSVWGYSLFSLFLLLFIRLNKTALFCVVVNTSFFCFLLFKNKRLNVIWIVKLLPLLFLIIASLFICFRVVYLFYCSGFLKQNVAVFFDCCFFLLLFFLFWGSFESLYLFLFFFTLLWVDEPDCFPSCCRWARNVKWKRWR